MSFFQAFFSSEWTEGKAEVPVCCPFDHHTEGGLTYKETNPSAHINNMKGVFHCKVCGEGLSEIGFIARVLGTSYESALSLLNQFKKSDDVSDWVDAYKLEDETKDTLNKLNISKEVVEELNIRTEQPEYIAIPVTMYGKLLDVRNYNPTSTDGRKILSKKGTMAGLIIPYDIWAGSDKDKWTLVCAGEKDMMVARTHGFNAICITGGEGKLPVSLEEFKDRKVAIVYDNDAAGIKGANNLAAELVNYTKTVRVVTNFHEVCHERGEDITDFFNRYKRSREDLIRYIIDTPDFTIDDATTIVKTKYPQVTLLEATQPQYVGKLVQSNVQVVATYEKAFTVPTTIMARKTSFIGADANNKMDLNEERMWALTEGNVQDVLKLIDNNFTENQIADNIRDLLKINRKEYSITVSKPTKETVYKCNVIDIFSSDAEETASIEFETYVLGKKLEAGKKYNITYKTFPHPYKGQTLTMIITDVKESADGVSAFKLTDNVKQNLQLIKELPGTVEERVDNMVERVKSFIQYDGYNDLIKAFEFAYHTVLEFDLGNHTGIRGYLDTLIVAESRVGKSTTAEALQKLYGLGVFTSLAGNSATVPGLIGGSNKVNNSFQTRAGVIPQNHRGLIIFEELAKSNANIIKELTDIRSSGKVRIARVSGTMELPALVRMITLTNARSTGTTMRSIKSYPNGIEILVDLIGTPEDIARYDIMLVMGETGNKEIDPFWMPPTPFTEELYRDRIRWIWSRRSDQIVITKEVAQYILQKANEINKEYDSYIKIFGTEAWKKITRLAIAIAGYLVSTDDTYEKIIVKKEHIDYAVEYYVNLYDNQTFKFKEFVENERMYTTIDEQGVNDLQSLYNSYPAVIIQLEKASRVSRSNLQVSTGLSSEDFNKVIAKMVRCLFIKFENADIIPTERFRIGVSQIKKGSYIKKVGEYV